VVENHTEEALSQLADTQNQLLLVGSPLVVSNLMKFHDYAKNGNKVCRNADEHDLLLTELIKSMRADLYKSSKANQLYPIIHLSGNAPR